MFSFTMIIGVTGTRACGESSYRSVAYAAIFAVKLGHSFRVNMFMLYSLRTNVVI